MHSFPVRIYYEDTDAGGIVYYANYLKFAERARTEALREAGLSHARMLQDSGIAIVVRRCEVDYCKPAHLDEHLSVDTQIDKTGRASLEMTQKIRRGQTLLTCLKLRLACIDRKGHPVPLPDTLRDALSQLSE